MNPTLQKIRDAKDTRTETIEVGEWGVSLTLIEPVRNVVTELQEEYLQLDPATGLPLEGSDSESFGMGLLVAMVHDDQGNPLFESIEQANEVLGEKSIRVQTKLVERCSELVRIPTEEDLEEAEGN